MAKLAIDGSTLTPTSEAKATAMQEKASLVVIKEGINNNKVFTKDEIVEGKGNSGKSIQKKIFEQYPAKYQPNLEWLDTFWKQQDTFLNAKIAGKKIGTSTHYQEYDRDNPNGFMDFITDLVREQFGIGQKDTWNPADIWVVENKKQVREHLIAAAQSVDINRLNSTLRAMLKNKSVIGVSLKKITKGKAARWEVVNLTDTPFSEKNDYNFELDHIRFNGGIRPDDKNWQAQDTTVFVYENHSPWVDIQVTQTTRRWANLKFEPTQRGASGARLGKAPVDMVKELMEDFKLNKTDVREVMSNAYFPRHLDEFLKDKQYYKELFNKVKSTLSFADMGSNTGNQFVDACVTLYEYAEEVGDDRGPKSEYAIRSGLVMTKLMQLFFLHILAILRKRSQKQLDEFVTGLVFLSMKKGKRFGPFGKLY